MLDINYKCISLFGCANRCEPLNQSHGPLITGKRERKNPIICMFHIQINKIGLTHGNIPYVTFVLSCCLAFWKLTGALSIHSTSNCAPASANFSCSSGISTALGMGTSFCAKISPTSNLSGWIFMIDTPVTRSSFKMAWIIGEAPRHRGNRLAWTLTIPLQITT